MICQSRWDHIPDHRAGPVPPEPNRSGHWRRAPDPADHGRDRLHSPDHNGWVCILNPRLANLAK